MPSIYRLSSVYRILQVLLILNVVFILYFFWQFYNNQLLEENEKRLRTLPKPIEVEIWSKASIGQYLWEYILDGKWHQTHSSNAYIEGNVSYLNVQFIFRSGPSLRLESLLSFSITNLIIVLNFRSPEKRNYARKWLDTIRDNKTDLNNVGIIALGDEHCHNRWILDYLHHSRSKFKFLYIVYDWNGIDDRATFQWPLGVATYRDFPRADHTSLNVHSPRPYVCNFIATLYPNSSRTELARMFESSQILQEACVIRTRKAWKSDETPESMQFYVQALRESELTLSPVGVNHECYRILEAVEYGSIPVVEHNPAYIQHRGKSSCDRDHAYRVFHKHQAPFIYVSNWTTDLAGVLQTQRNKKEEDKVRERVQLIKWYHRFRTSLRKHLIDTTYHQFTVGSQIG